MDSLFGYLGIDTKYEKELLYYQPVLEAVRSPYKEKLTDREYIAIQRAELFSIGDILDRYEGMIKDIESLLIFIEEKEDVSTAKNLFKEGKYEELQKYESNLEVIESFTYLDKYTILLYIKENLQSKVNHIKKVYAVKLTQSKEIEDIEEAEKRSLEEWKILLSKVNNIRDAQIGSSYPDTYIDEHFEYDKASDTSNDILRDLSILSEEKERFHNDLGDVMFNHRTFIEDMVNVMSVLKTIILKPSAMIGENNPGFKNEIEEYYHKKEARRLLESSFFEHMNLYYGKKKRLPELLIGLSNDIGIKIDYLHRMNQGVFPKIENTLVVSETMGEGNLSGLNEILGTQYIKLRESYKKTIADMNNLMRKEAEIFLEVSFFCLEKEKIRRYHTLLDNVR